MNLNSCADCCCCYNFRLNDLRCCIVVADEILRSNRLSVKVPDTHYAEQNSCCAAENFRAAGSSADDFRAVARFVADIWALRDADFDNRGKKDAQCYVKALRKKVEKAVCC